MAVVKASELRTKTPDELQTQLLGLKKEAYNLRFQGATGEITSTARMRLVRREIARIKTVIKEQSKDKEKK